MALRANFEESVALSVDEIDWVASPMAGVDRRMLDRLGEDGARATSIVRYAPNSTFSAHVHHGGEEFLVLAGVFQDQHGDYPAGTYVRNPPTSQHTPGASEGCTIFVKLGQFELGDRTFTRIDTSKIGRVADPRHEGIAVTPLYEDDRETVQLAYLEAGMSIDLVDDGGIEVLVIAGELKLNERIFSALSWIRHAPGAGALALAGPAGAKLWIKRRHLRPDVLRSSAYNR